MANTLVITGGSRGIGAETAKLAARNGYAVCVGYPMQWLSFSASASEN